MARPARRFAAAGVLAVLLATGGSPAAAHPHIWIEHSVGLLMGPAGLEGVRFTWEFDPLFSSLIFQEFDTDRDKKFSATETHVIEAKHLANLKPYDYFVELKIDGTPAPIAIKDFEVSVGGGGQVSYAFTVPVAGPAPRASVDIAVYDPTYFTAFALRPKSPVAVRPAQQYAADCQVVSDTAAPAGEAVRCSYRRLTG